MTPAGPTLPAPPSAPSGTTVLDELVSRRPELAGTRDDIVAAYDLLASTFAANGMVLTCGNGGSAADSAHVVGELMKGMARRRPLPPPDAEALRRVGPPGLGGYLATRLERALPAIDLCSQQALLSAVANDIAGDLGFAQQVSGYGGKGDLLWALSTSGRSRNVVLAALTAKAKGLRVLAFTGPSPSDLSGLADVAVRVPASTTPLIQELHQSIYHALCELLEASFFAG